MYFYSITYISTNYRLGLVYYSVNKFYSYFNMQNISNVTKIIKGYIEQVLLQK